MDYNNDNGDVDGNEDSYRGDDDGGNDDGDSEDDNGDIDCDGDDNDDVYHVMEMNVMMVIVLVKGTVISDSANQLYNDDEDVMMMIEFGTMTLTMNENNDSFVFNLKDRGNAFGTRFRS